MKVVNILSLPCNFLSAVSAICMHTNVYYIFALIGVEVICLGEIVSRKSRTDSE